MKIRSFRDLEVWRLSSELSKEIGKLVKTFPKSEEYKLTSDLHRAARSVPTNISEGFGRFHFSEKLQFYNIARGSTTEVQNHIQEAFNSEYITDVKKEYFLKRYHVVEVKLNNLIQSTIQARKRSDKKRKQKK
jgi:four helix bundle protein